MSFQTSSMVLVLLGVLLQREEDENGEGDEDEDVYNDGDFEVEDDDDDDDDTLLRLWALLFKQVCSSTPIDDHIEFECGTQLGEMGQTCTKTTHIHTQGTEKERPRVGRN